MSRTSSVALSLFFLLAARGEGQLREGREPVDLPPSSPSYSLCYPNFWETASPEEAAHGLESLYYRRPARALMAWCGSPVDQSVGEVALSHAQNQDTLAYVEDLLEKQDDGALDRYMSELLEEHRKEGEGKRYFGFALGPAGGGPHPINQHGNNADTVCYPDHPCAERGTASAIEGYRWFYDLGTGLGATGEAFVGLDFGRARAELAAGVQRFNQMTQEFGGVVELFADPEAMPVYEAHESTVVSHPSNSIGSLTATTLTGDVYFGLLPEDDSRPFDLLVGFGGGAAFSRISDLSFSIYYTDEDNPGRTYEPPLSSFSGSKRGGVSGWHSVGRFHVGADFKSKGPANFGLRLTLSQFGAFSHEGNYESHAMHETTGVGNFFYEDHFENLKTWSLLGVVRWK